jgi:hypothetical protein
MNWKPGLEEKQNSYREVEKYGKYQNLESQARENHGA